MISQTNVEHLFEHRSRMPMPLARVGCLVITLGVFSFLGFVVWLNFFAFNRPPEVQEVAIADFDSDGHLDAFVTISPNGEPYVGADFVLFGDGHGRFTPGEQTLDNFNFNTFAVSSGDLNADGLVDAVVANRVYWNVGNGRLVASYYLRSESRGAFRWQLRLADLDGDADLDLFGAACCGSAIVEPKGQQEILYSYDTVWFNNGDSQFADSGQKLGELGSNAVALGDLNGDGSVDAFVASGQTAPGTQSSWKNPNLVWFNDGKGQFSDSGQRLGEAESTAVALGDFDNDSDLDAVVGNNGRDELWLNDGNGNFSLSRQRFDSGETFAVFVADLNNDDLLDLVIVGKRSSRVWLNEGAATFKAGQRLRHQGDDALALGDVNEDGFVDILVAGLEEYRVWLGQGNGRFAALSPRLPYP
ncbi:MAG: VCBS repeat-containing protein [Anaerolineae bacterium]|nr:VCBS repeat-containing protein [Anaerolineae bacterium]